MKTRLFACALCASAIGLVQAVDFDASGFSKSIDIVVPASSIAQGVTLPDFPALVRLSPSIDGFSYADFANHASGADLAFVDSDGNLLPHEIDTWDASGESLVWVKVLTLQRGTRLKMYYGNSAYSPTLSPSQTWSAFKGVWHMNESGETAEPDVSGNGLAATPAGSAVGDMTATPGGGVVGSCRKNYTGGTWDGNGYLSVPDYTLGDTFTVSGWFNTAFAGGAQRLVTRRAASADEGGWHVEWDYYGGRDQVVAYGSSSAHASGAVGQHVNEWVALTFAFEGSTVSVYTNGAFCAAAAIDAATDNGNPLTIGGSTTNDDAPFNGYYDELRLCGGALSAERIAADYATATDPGFFQYGKPINPSDYTKFVQITASATAVPAGETVRDFPALVRLSESIDGFSYDDFLPDGADLAFATADGIVLPHEIDTWNTAGESLVWVRIPAFTNGTVIYAYWGKATASGDGASNAWAGFKGVWHMNKSGSTDEPDAAGNGLDATPAGVSDSNIGKMVATDGVVGAARVNQQDYDKTFRNRLLVPDCTLGDTFTVSGWFYQRYIYQWHRLFSRKNDKKDDGWDVQWEYEGTEGQGTKMSIQGNASKTFTVDVGYIRKSWAYLTFVYKGENVSVYTNGALCATGKVNPVQDNGNPIAIGGNPDGSHASFEGAYDEVRLGVGALSAGRIAADYKTVADASFFSYGGVGAPAVDPPAFEAPTIVNDSGTLKIAVSMTSGTGRPYVRFTSASGSTDVALAESPVAGPQSYEIAVPDSLVSDRTYSFAAVGVNANGGEVVVPGARCFYTGSPVVAKASDAAEDGPVAGTFSISRGDAYGSLEVAYSLSGTAVAGTDYQGGASGTVVIPDGESSAAVAIMPKANAALNADTSVVLSLAEGLYVASPSSVAMTIANLAPVTKRDFRRCVEFTFPMEFLGENETLENFPVLVRISTAILGFKYSDFLRAGGGDMMFTDDAKHPIHHEVDTWDDEGTSLVWVTVPSLGRGTRIRMYYGNGANPAGVELVKWPGFAGVWHMGEANGTAFDSTTNGFDAAAMQNARAKPADLAAAADGAVGAARVNQAGTTYYDLDDPWGADNRRNYLSAPLGAGLALGSQFSFSGWFRTTGYTEGGETVVYKRASGYNWGWSIVREHTTWNSDEGYTPGEDVWLTLKVADGEKRFTVPNMRNNWVHLFVSFDQVPTGNSENPYKTEAAVYANGVLLDTVHGSTRVRDNDFPLTFGNINSLTDGQAFSGQYDELRMKAGASSANWAKAEYLTVADPAFATAGEVHQANGGLFVSFR